MSPRTATSGAWGLAASTGQDFTHHSIVDAHFEACVETYRKALDLVGLRPGWRVLDAGCGPGDFLPWICDLVGPAGAVSAIDLAPENADLAARRVSESVPGVAADVRTGDIRELPYPDDAFDAVWCSNTVQYLDDDSLLRALAEFRRVTRPGGLVAVKDLDARLITVQPGDPDLFADFFRAAAANPGYARQLRRSGALYRYLRAAGLESARQRTLLAEHFAPLTEAAQEFYSRACAQLAAQIPHGSRTDAWRVLADPDHPDHPLRSADGYVREGVVLCVGTVPAAQ